VPDALTRYTWRAKPSPEHAVIRGCWAKLDLQIARYPPLPKAEDIRFGVGPHSDSGFLSLLLQDDVGGLEVPSPLTAGPDRSSSLIALERV
jgi:hypothetical protein